MTRSTTRGSIPERFELIARAMGLWAAIAIATASMMSVSASAAPLTGFHRDVTLDSSSASLPLTLSFPGTTSTQTLSIPVPVGLTPLSISATVDLPPLVDRATIDVLDDDRLLGRVDLPLGAGGPVSIPLTGVRIENHMAVVTLRSTLVPFAGQCLVDWRDLPLRLRDVSVDYGGDEVQPTVIADFLPPALQKLTVYVPQKPTELEIQSAMQVATAVVAAYPNRQVTVDLHWLGNEQNAPDHAPGLLERQISIREDDAAQSALTVAGPGPLLTLSGKGEGLADQVRLLTSNLSGIAVAPLATAVGIPARKILPPASMTLYSLGQNQLSNVGIGRVTVEIGIDQTRLGRSADNVTVRLTGHHTPLPGTWGGRVSVIANGTEIDSWAATDDGNFDRVVKIPNQQLSRFTTLDVMLEAVGEQAGCGLERPVSLVIDDSSEVTSDVSKPPLPEGFASLPQALLPDMTFALTEGDFADAWRAVSIAVGLQRLTPVPLTPTIASVADVVAAHKSAVIIAANGGIPDSVTLPLRQIEENELSIALAEPDEPATLHVTPGMSFGSLQTYFNGDATIVALTSVHDVADVDSLVTWLNEDPKRWQKLSGDVLFKVGDREPKMLSVAIPSDIKTESESGLPPKVLIAAGVLALVGAVVAAVVILRRRAQ